MCQISFQMKSTWVFFLKCTLIQIDLFCMVGWFHCYNKNNCCTICLCKLVWMWFFFFFWPNRHFKYNVVALVVFSFESHVVSDSRPCFTCTTIKFPQSQVHCGIQVFWFFWFSVRTTTHGWIRDYSEFGIDPSYKHLVCASYSTNAFVNEKVLGFLFFNMLNIKI